jgi:DNA (cytosine-5)-methyltransferase 1
MRAIELFSGIGGFRIALDELGFETVFANDIDEKASFVYKNNFGTEAFIQGDINHYKKLIPSHNILTAGFPCQPFSSAGKKKGVADPRGSLFESIVNILKTNLPKYFVLENVKRLISMESGVHFATILKALSDCGYYLEWRVINATQFGLPQSRERIIITGIKKDNFQPTACLIESNESFCFFKDPFNYSNWVSLSKHRASFKNWGLCFNGNFFTQSLNYAQFEPIVRLRDILQDDVPEIFDFTVSTLERIPNSEYVNKFFNGVQILYNQKGGARMGYSVFGTEGIAPTLTSTTSRHYERYEINGKYRRLTNIEYARIQGFPDNHCQGVSVYDQYTLFGNAVPPQMVKWAISKITKDESFLPSAQQMELF